MDLNNTTDENTEVDENRRVERQTAKIASISEITGGKYFRKEGWEPNYVLTNKNEKISRVNLIAIAVTIPDNGDSIFVDDGTGKIEIRSFENNQMFSDITIGDIILITGRPREFNNALYINGEIIKKISNKGWIEYRKKEIILKNIRMPTIEQEDEVLNKREEKVEESKPALDEFEEIMLKIKELDSGEGCEIQEIAAIYPNGEEIIEQLLLKGEIFEISPGKVKVLE